MNLPYINSRLKYIIENITLYDNFECVLKLLLNLINKGIKNYKLTNLALKGLTVLLHIFKNTKIIIDEFSKTEMKFLVHYEISVFASVKMLYESYMFSRLNWKSGEVNIKISKDLGNKNEMNKQINKSKRKNDFQFSHFFFEPLIDIYNFIIFLNNLKLCNSPNKYLECFFCFAIKNQKQEKEINEKKEKLQQKKRNFVDKIHNYSKEEDNKIDNTHAILEFSKEKGEKEYDKTLFDTSAFCVEYDATLYYLLTYRSLCLFLVNDSNAINSLGNINFKLIVKSLNNILFDTIIMYMWNKKGTSDAFLNSISHKFLTCHNEESRCLSIFYFSCFFTFIKFLNKAKKHVLITPKNCLFFRIFIYFLCFYLEEYQDIIEKNVRDEYFIFIINYLFLMDFSNQKNDTNKEGIEWEELKAEDIKEKNAKDENMKAENMKDENTKNENMKNKDTKDLVEKSNDISDENMFNSFFDSIINILLKYFTSLIDKYVLPNVLVLLEKLNDMFIKKKEINESFICSLGKICTLNFYVINKFLTNEEWENESYINENENEKNVKTTLWKLFLYLFNILEKVKNTKLEKNLKVLLMHLFLEKVYFLKEEKLASSLLKCYLHNSTVEDLNFYLEKVKEYEEKEIYKILKDKNMEKLKIFYIKIIVFIHFVNSNESLNDEIKIYYTKKILNVFIHFWKSIIVMYYYEMKENEQNEKTLENKINKKLKAFGKTSIKTKTNTDELWLLKKQVILSALGFIQNIFTLIKNKNESISFYFIRHLLIEETGFGISPMIVERYNVKDKNNDNTDLHFSFQKNNRTDSFVSFYVEEIFSFSIKCLYIFFISFIDNTNLINEVFSAFVQYVCNIVNICEKNNIDASSSYLVFYAINANDENYMEWKTDWSSKCNSKYDNRKSINTDLLLDVNQLHQEKIIRTEHMSIYFTEIVNILKMFAFQKQEMFKNIMNEISGENKIIIYKLMQESINMEKENKKKAEQEEQPLDFNF